MSRTVDERVVSMQFDNRNFESNVRTTMSTLDKLKARLNLSGASKGLEGINSAAKNCNLSVIGSSIDGVNVRFSKLQAAAAHALGDIATRAYRTGESILKSLTIQPITTGFNEYELKMNSIQTIMASTGESLAAVNGYLNELNKYSDETIYSFADMTQNIGKFTNAGVKLEDAVVAIKGIANEAALSGANANEASRAMYNFSQALSTGYVQRIDWKSIELANMATVEFKEQLLEQAIAMGTVKKNAEGMYAAFDSDKFYNTSQMFIETLDEQWLTSEVLIETLKKYADAETDIGSRATKAATEVKTFSHMMDTLRESAQSGWAQTWETIVGDFDEGKNLWTSLNEVIGGWISKSADKRNNMLSGVLDSNWEKLASRVEDAGVPVTEFQKALIETGKTHGKITDAMIEEEGGFIKSLTKGWATTDIVIKTLEKFTGATEGVSDATTKVTDKVEYFQKVFDKVWRGDFGNGAKRFKALADAGYDYAAVQGLVNKHAAGYKLTAEDLVDVIADLSEAEQKNLGFTEEEVKALQELKQQAEETGTPIRQLIDDLSKPTGRELLIESFVNLFKKFQPIIESFKGKWSDAFGNLPTTGDVLKGLIDKFADFVDNLEFSKDTLAEIDTVMQGFVSTLQTLSIMSGGVFGWLVKTLKQVCKNLGYNFWDLTVMAADLITKFYQWISTNNVLYESLLDLGTAVVNFVTSTVDKIINWVAAFLEIPEVASLISSLATSFKDALSGLSSWLQGFVPLVTEFFNAVSSMDSITFDGIASAFGTLLAGVLERFGIVVGGLRDPVGTLVDLVVSLFAALGNKSGSPEEFASNFEKIKASVNKVLAPISKLIGKLREWGGVVVDWLASLKDAENIPQVIGEGIGRAIGTIILEIKNAISNLAKGIWDGMTGAGTDGVAGLVNGLMSGIGNIASALFTIGSTMIATICEVLGIHSPSKEMHDVGEFTMAGLANGITDAAKDVFQALISFGSELIRKVADIFVNVINWVKNLNLGQVLSITIVGGMIVAIYNIGKMAANLTKAVTKLTNNLAGVFGGVSKVIGSVANGIDRVGKSIAFKQYAAGIKDLAIGIALLAGSIALLTLAIHFDPGATKQAFWAITTIMGIFAAYTAMVFAMKKFGEVGDFDIKEIVISMMGIAGAVLILASAASKIGQIHVDNIGASIFGVIAFMAVMGTVITVMTNKISNKKAKNLDNIGYTFLKLAGAIWIMAQAAKVAGSLDPTEAENGYKAVIVFSVLIAGLIWCTKLAGNNVGKIGNTFLKIGGLLLMMVAAVAVLGLMDPTKLDQGLEAISILEFVIIGLVGVLELISTIGGNLDSIGGIILKVGGAFLMMSAGLVMLALIPVDKVRTSIEAMIVVAIVMMVLIGVLSTINVGKLDAIGSTILGIGAAMAFIAVAAKIFGSLDSTEFGNAMDALLVVGLGIAGMVALLGKIDAKNLKGVGVSLLAAAGAIAILAIVASVIGLIDLAILAKGVVAVGILGLVVMGILKASEKAVDAKSTLIGLTIAIAALAAAVIALSLIANENPMALATAVIGLSVVLLVLAETINRIGSTQIPIKSILAMVGAIIAIGGVLYILGTLQPGNALAAAGALSATILALAGAMILINKFGKASSGAKTSKNTLVMLEVLTAVAIALGLTIRLIGGLQPGEALAAAGALSITLLALAGAMILINKFGSTSGTKKSGNMLSTMLGLVAMVAVIGLVLAALGNLDPGSALAAAGALRLTMLALAGAMVIIGNFGGGGGSIGSLLAMSVALIAIGAAMMMLASIPAGQLWSVFGALAATMAVLTVVVVVLAAAFTALAPGAALVAAVLLSIAAVVLSVGAASLMFANALQIVGMALPLVASGLVILVTSLAGCSEHIGDFIKVAGGLLIGMAAIGIGLTVLSVGVLAIAAALAIGILAVTATLTVGIVLLSTGLAIGMLAISAALTAGIVLLAEGLTAGILVVAAGLSIGLVAVAAAFAAGMLLVGAALNVGLTLLSVGIIIVSAAIYIFAGALMFGAAAVYLMASAIAFLGICISDGLAAGIAAGIETVTAAVSGLANGVIGTICDVLGIHSPSVVMQQLGQYTGQGFAQGISESEGEVTGAASGLANAAKVGLGTAGAEGGTEFNTEALTNMDIDSLLSGTGIDTSSLTGAFGTAGTESGSSFNLGAMESMDFTSLLSGSGLDTGALTGAFGTAGTESGTAFTEGANTTTSMQPTLDNMLGEISNTRPQFTDAGASVLTAFGEGLTSASSSVTAKLTTAVGSMTTAVRGSRSGFHSAGSYLVSGFASGISANTFRAEAAAAAMANAAERAAKEALAIRSPSRVFKEIGGYVPQGFAEGIGLFGGMISRSVDTMAGSAIDGTKDVISRIADAIDADIDSQPTIRPVLDLSEVSAGASSIGSMFNMRPSVRAMSNIGTISSMMNGYQNGSNDDVVSAINKLAKNLGGAGGDTYQVNGVTYDDGSNIKNFAQAVIRQARIERRV